MTQSFEIILEFFLFEVSSLCGIVCVFEIW